MRRDPHCSVSWGCQGLGGPPLSDPNVHTALPGPPAHPLSKHTGPGLPLGGGSCWETPALCLSWEQKEASLPWRLGCPMEASLLL